MRNCVDGFARGQFAAGQFEIVGDFVDDELGRLATQYREAEKFIGLLSAYLQPVADALRAVCPLPETFDILTGTGEQLTFLGRRMGWPRRHCLCVTTPVFGFEWQAPAQGPRVPVVGFCEGATWLACGATGAGEVDLADDEVYRRFLLVRRYQMLGLYDVASLQVCAQTMWGAAATVHDYRVGTTVLAPGRDLTAFETDILPLTLRVMPLAPGIRPMVHFGAGPIFGFGEGWAGFCEGSQLFCPAFVDPYDCNA